MSIAVLIVALWGIAMLTLALHSFQLYMLEKQVSELKALVATSGGLPGKAGLALDYSEHVLSTKAGR
ncbi:MAG TPA: hypothetical protein VEB64_04110 [Azospirillaceae bacterium]|nr:hypothetical protein [Azospirillaceae bacterium]